LSVMRTITNSEIAELYVKGMTLQEIASTTGVPRETARVILHKLGIQTRHKAVTYHAPASELSPDVALLLGIHAGDGWVTDGQWGVRPARRDVGMVKAIVILIRDVLGVEPVVSFPNDRSVMLRSCQPQVADFFLGYGFPRGKKARIVKVPQVIGSSINREITRQFLRGLFSADGCFTHTGRSASCTLSVSSPALRDGFVELAVACGFRFYLYSNRHKGGHNKVPLQVANMSRRDDVSRWMEQIGSMSDEHQRRYAEWRKLVGL
jgi:hypothetical protein